jgi:hypothetical protein
MSPVANSLHPLLFQVPPDSVRESRLDWPVAAGYPARPALALGERADVDLDAAAALLRRGCPVGTALRILL